ncbi:hypothetical protein COE99_09415 [Bacillus toyonensis]|uniref:hypothetical protein n=1 Tax=Bacillus toyonensis TaxID=155322 RepID=UPI000BFD2655|nr:hypothetical protein [Bacillus toyonensis]PHC09919.1 hypothetical protein COE99_09415 [Bacillus toyonensis]
MWVDINELKDFIPFGSAMFGALIGGSFTYRISKRTEKREMRKKRLEALFKLESIMVQLIKQSDDMKNRIITRDEATENLIEAKKELDEYCGVYSKNIIDFQTECRSLAINISPIMFNHVISTFETISKRYTFILNIRKKSENTNLYHKDNIEDMEVIIQELCNLNKFILEESHEYADYYLKTYIQKYKN